jgi:plastocyanin
VILGLSVAACGGPQPTSTASSGAPVEGSAAIAGKVHFTGTPPPPGTIRLDGDKTCVELNKSNQRQLFEVLTGDGNTLQNVFVYVKDGLQGRMYAPPTEPVVLDQKQCEYIPHVLGIQVGQPLEIRNSDPLMHNIRADAQINRGFNQGQPVPMSTTKTFATAEVMVPIKCDVHAWMRAHIGVLDHPFFAVTGADGAFGLQKLPAGTYTLEAWHEKLGTTTTQVTVTEGESKDVTFTFAISS